jgi:hypothetical protein
MRRMYAVFRMLRVLEDDAIEYTAHTARVGFTITLDVVTPPFATPPPFIPSSQTQPFYRLAEPPCVTQLEQAAVQRA